MEDRRHQRINSFAKLIYLAKHKNMVKPISLTPLFKRYRFNINNFATI